MSGAPFDRSMRLHDSRDFERLFRQSKRSTDDLLTVLARENDLKVARLGLAISRKCGGKSVRRSRIKRLIRESFRLNSSQLRGLDLVVIGRAGLQPLESEALRRSLERHWRIVGKRCSAC